MFVMSGLLTTTIVSQLLSVPCKRWFPEMKINGMQLIPAADLFTLLFISSA